MFEYDLTHWTTFIVATFLLNISPGPDIAFILGHTVKNGRKAGTAAMFGIWTGAMGHVIMAVCGLSALIAASATAFSVIKWIGVLYLLWLGLCALRTSDDTTSETENTAVTPNHNLWRIYRNGALIDLLNPKVAIFFLAFLPQFTHPDAGPIWAQMLLHGSLIIVGAALTEPPLIILGNKLGMGLRNNPTIGKWLNRVFGTLFIGLAARLALAEK